MGIKIEFVVRIVLITGSSLSLGSSFNDKVESRGISWNLVESHPMTIKVGFRSGSSYNNKVSESNDKVEFLQMIK